MLGAGGIASRGVAALPRPKTPPARELFHHASGGNRLFTLFASQRLHVMQPGKSVLGVENRRGILAPQVVFDVLASERSAAADHRKAERLAFEILNDVFHLQG